MELGCLQSFHFDFDLHLAQLAAFAAVPWVLPLLCMGMYSGLVFGQREILVYPAIRVESTHLMDSAICIVYPAWLWDSLPADAGKAS